MGTEMISHISTPYAIKSFLSLNTAHNLPKLQVPNLVGEFVGARLIININSHAGSLFNLAKHPASTMQILGAKKVLLFRVLKTKTIHQMDPFIT